MVVGVFAGSRSGKYLHDQETIARIVGYQLAHNNYVTVYGGGASGLMHQMATGVKQGCGKLIAVELVREGWLHSPLTNNVYEHEHLHERQHDLISRCDAYIALPGGLGSLFEIAHVLCLKDINVIPSENPLICMGLEYWAELRQLLEKMVGYEFSSPDVLDSITYVDTVCKAMELLEEYRHIKSAES